jgi:sporulation protein YlmC with PRC-barrel domain
MAHYGTLQNYRLSDDQAEDIRGRHIYGVDDDKLGKIDDVIFDHASGDIRYVVVDTGGWLSSKKFLVPTDRIRTSQKHEDDYQVNLTKEQIEKFPPYKESDLDSEKDWGEYENRYRSKWVDGPVMHREATDRNITPTTYQQEHSQESRATNQGASTQFSSSQDYSSQASRSQGFSSTERARGGEFDDEDTGRIIPAGTDTVVIGNSAAGIGSRWDTFQSRLRERRRHAVASCTTCISGPSSIREESADTERKAV